MCDGLCSESTTMMGPWHLLWVESPEAHIATGSRWYDHLISTCSGEFLGFSSQRFNCIYFHMDRVSPIAHKVYSWSLINGIVASFPRKQVSVWSLFVVALGMLTAHTPAAYRRYSHQWCQWVWPWGKPTALDSGIWGCFVNGSDSISENWSECARFYDADAKYCVACTVVGRWLVLARAWRWHLLRLTTANYQYPW